MIPGSPSSGEENLVMRQVLSPDLRDASYPVTCPFLNSAKANRDQHGWGLSEKHKREGVPGCHVNAL